MIPAQATKGFEDYIKQLEIDQFFEWTFWQPFSIQVPANGSIEREIDIKSDGHFKVLCVTGNYTTLDGGVDDGTNHLTLQLLDGSDELRLFSGPVPLDLFLSPGRVLAPGVAGNPSQQLFYPIEFGHIFGAKGSISMRFANNASDINTVNLLFLGKKLLAMRKEPNTTKPFGY